MVGSVAAATAVAPSAKREAPSGIPRWVIFVVAGMFASAMLGAVAVCGIGAFVLVALQREKAAEEASPGEKWRIVGGEARSAEEKRRAAAEPEIGQENIAPRPRTFSELSPEELEAVKKLQPQPTERIADGWTIRDEPAARFRAAFPAPPKTIDPLTQISPSENGEGEQMSADAKRAMLEQLGMRVVVAEQMGRKYLVVATPMPFDDSMASFWLEAAEMTLQLQYREFQVEPAASGSIDGRPYRDFFVRRGQEVKLVRLTPGEGFAYSLQVESNSEGAQLAFDDPTVTRFFASFERL